MKEREIILHFAVPGTPMVKKNQSHVSTHHQPGKLKGTQYWVKRPFPLTYNSKGYKEWANRAIVACNKAKNTAKGIKFPIDIKMNLRVIFYFDRHISKVDISNLYEGIQDVMSGSPGSEFKDIPAKAYQIIEDDNIRFIASHDGSRVAVDKLKPRTEVFLERY